MRMALARIKFVLSLAQSKSPKSILMVLPLMLALSLSGLSLCLLVVMQMLYLEDDFDPFAPYAAFEPGRPLPRFPSLECQTVHDASGSVPVNTRVCDLHPNDSSFHLIRIRVCNHRIQDVTFQAHMLQVYDVVRYWGPANTLHPFEVGYTVRSRTKANTPAAFVSDVWIGRIQWPPSC